MNSLDDAQQTSAWCQCDTDDRAECFATGWQLAEFFNASFTVVVIAIERSATELKIRDAIGEFDDRASDID